jgi:NAD(P)H-dependent FMN reductase
LKRANGLILVVPEYNHSFPGLLKHVLDSHLEECIHKAAGICGVSAGLFGVRMIENLLPVLRELGLVTIFLDVYFGNAGKPSERVKITEYHRGFMRGGFDVLPEDGE